MLAISGARQAVQRAILPIVVGASDRDRLGAGVVLDDHVRVMGKLKLPLLPFDRHFAVGDLHLDVAGHGNRLFSDTRHFQTPAR